MYACPNWKKVNEIEMPPGKAVGKLIVVCDYCGAEKPLKAFQKEFTRQQDEQSRRARQEADKKLRQERALQDAIWQERRRKETEASLAAPPKKEEPSTPQYEALRVASELYKVCGYIVAIGGGIGVLFILGAAAKVESGALLVQGLLAGISVFIATL